MSCWDDPCQNPTADAIERRKRYALEQAAPDLAHVCLRLMAALSDEMWSHEHTGRAAEAEKLGHIPDQAHNARIMKDAYSTIDKAGVRENPPFRGPGGRIRLGAALTRQEN